VVGRVVDEPVAEPGTELGCCLVAAVAEGIIAAGVEPVVQEDAAVGREDHAGAALWLEIDGRALRRSRGNLQMQRHGLAVETDRETSDLSQPQVRLAVDGNWRRAVDWQAPSGELGRGNEEVALSIAQHGDVTPVYRVDDDAGDQCFDGWSERNGRCRLTGHDCRGGRRFGCRSAQRRGKPGNGKQEQCRDEARPGRPTRRRRAPHRAYA